MIKVVSMRNGGVKPAPGDVVVRVDRGSVLGNPFVMRVEAERDVVCDQYAEWLREEWKRNPAVKTALLGIAVAHKEGKSVALACWCAPKRCHADFIKHAAESIADKL